MVTTIKGPIKLGVKQDIPEALKRIIKLPFEAEGWKSTVNSELVNPEPVKTIDIQINHPKDDLTGKEEIPEVKEEEKIEHVEKAKVVKGARKKK